MDLTNDPSTTTVAELIEHRSANGSAPFLLAARGERTITFADLAREVEIWRERLEADGVPRGGTVALSAADPLDFAIAFLGALAAGVWVAPLDPALRLANPVAFRERTTLARVSHVAIGENSSVTLRRLVGNDDAPASKLTGGLVMASSGTTGVPKVMRLSVNQLLGTASLVATHNELTPGDRGFNPLPLFHINAEVVGLLASLTAGSSLVLDERFHRTDFWDLVTRFAATWINAVPAIISRLLPLREGESIPSNVRFVRSASAPLSASLMTSFEDATGLPVIESYGMTEAASQICANPLTAERRAGSVGRPVGVTLRVSGPDGPAPAGEPGEVEVSGPTVIRRYDSPGYDDRFTSDGWLRTSDVGYLDDDGFLFLVGRTDDIINRGGEKIFPREIEEVLLAKPDVLAAAVVGEPDEVFGQVAVAYVQLDDVDDTTPLESLRPVLKDLCEALVAAFPRSRRPATVHVISRLPAHATGKIQKAALRSDPTVALLSQRVG